MSEGLLTQWRDRVVETETEISVVQEDINAIAQQRKALKQDIARYEKLVQREKGELLSKLEEVEEQARALEERCQRTQQQKAQVEEMYVQTLDNYESMHDIVKEIQASEQRLQAREDLEEVLQRESLAWAEEEQKMRERLSALQATLKLQRKRQSEEMTALETELAAVERQLLQQRQRQEREGRDDLAVARRSRCGFALEAATDAKSKEQQFINSNTSTGVPTRQLRQLKRNTTSTTDKCPLPETSVQPETKRKNVGYKKGAALSFYSAPVSRAASQALVAGGGDNLPVAVDSAAPTPHRAYSYAAGKKIGSRKRDVSLLGDATNL